MNKIEARKRRGKKAKAIIALSTKPRLVVFRSSANIYAQVIIKGANGDEVLSAASSLEHSFKDKEKDKETKTSVATKVGKLIAEKLIQKGYKEVAFDRNGYRYHGRVKAVADGAREVGLIF